MRRLVVWGVAACLAVGSGTTPAAAMPSNPQKVYGDGEIGQIEEGPDGTRSLVIRQHTEKLIINWNSFSIPADGVVHFEQPQSRKAVALNRVIGNDASVIEGRLSATGQLFLINPNGVLFTDTASVNARGIVISVLDIDDDDFADEKFSFSLRPPASTSSVTNRGRITTGQGGYVALLAPRVVNETVGENKAEVAAYFGTVMVGAGGKVDLVLQADGLVGMVVSEDVASPVLADPLVENSGVISADGGLVHISASARDEFTGAVISQKGSIRADSAFQRAGRIILEATGTGNIEIAAGATVEAAGTLEIVAPDDLVVRGLISRPLPVVDEEESGDEDPPGADEGDEVDESLWVGDVTLHAGGNRLGDGRVIFEGEGKVDWSKGKGDVIILYNPVAAPGGRKYESPTDFEDYVLLPPDGAGALLPFMLVNDVDDLNDIRMNLEGSYALAGNIDATDTQTTVAFDPIGTVSNPFTGILDGRGHVIEGLKVVTSPSGEPVGLFGVIGAGGRVERLGLEDVSISGSQNVGGLAGINEGVIQRAYVTGNVEGRRNAGGLVGINRGEISDAYSIAHVQGIASGPDDPENIGGLVGSLQGQGTLSRTYSAGTVTVPDTVETGAGLLIGAVESGFQGSVTGSFWRATGSDALPGVGTALPTNLEVTGLTEQEMKSAAFWEGDAWSGAASWTIDTKGDPEGEASLWRLYDGQTAPLLKDFLRRVEVRPDDVKLTYDGNFHGFDGNYTVGLPGITLPGQVQSPMEYRDAGEHPILLQGLYSTGQRGYDIRFVPGTLTINPRVIRIIAEPGQGKIYGLPDPESFLFQHEVDLVEGDEVTFSGSLARLPINPTALEPEEHVGEYALGLGTLASDNPNYVIADFVGATFEIRRRPIKVEVIEKEQIKVYGTEHVFGGQGVGWQIAEDSPYGLLPGDTFFGGLISAGAGRAAPVLRNVNNEIIGYEIEHTLYNPNYEIEFVGGTLTVLPKELTVTLKDPGRRLYGDPNPTFQLEYSGFVSELGDDERVLRGDLVFVGAPDRYAPVIEEGYLITPAGLEADNYDLKFVGARLYVDPRRVRVQVKDLTEKEYGEEIRPEDVELVEVPGDGNDGLVNNDKLMGYVASLGFRADADVLWENGQIAGYKITGDGLHHPNYEVEFVETDLKVVPAPLTVKAEDKSRVYGDPNPEFTVVYDGFKLNQTPDDLQGTLTFNEHDLHPLLPVNETGYEIIPGGLTSGNYTITFVPGTLTIQRRPIKVRLETPELEKLYGQEIRPEDVKLVVVEPDGLVPGGAPLAGVPASAGFAADAPVLYDPSGDVTYYTVTAGSVNNATNPNYDITFVDGKLYVKPQTLRVIAEDDWRYYGDSNPTFRVRYEGFRLDDADKIDQIFDGRLSFDAPDQRAPVLRDPVTGELLGYPITPKGLRSPNYSIEFVPGTLIIHPRPITVALVNPNLTKTYGDAITDTNSLWYVQSGNLVFGDQLTGTLASAGFEADAPVRDQDGNVIVYPITLGSLGHPNYDVQFAGGSLTVLPAPLTVRAGNVTREYGEDNPEIPVYYEGFKLGEDESVLGGQLVLTTVGKAADVVIGGYPITPGGLTSGNYSIRYVPGTLTITPAPLKVIVQDATRRYGEPNPEFQVTYEGFKLGQDASVLSGRLIFNTVGREAQVSKDGYPIVPSGLRSSNYDIEFVPGTLHVIPAPLIVRVEDARRRFGSPDPRFLVKFEGFVLDEDPSVLDGQLWVHTEAGILSPVGTYPIVAGGLSARNYDISYVDGILTVYIAPGDIQWPEEMHEVISAARAEWASLIDFSGVNLDCVDPADAGDEAAEFCSAF